MRTFYIWKNDDVIGEIEAMSYQHAFKLLRDSEIFGVELTLQSEIAPLKRSV